jgi:TonB family protein
LTTFDEKMKFYLLIVGLLCSLGFAQNHTNASTSKETQVFSIADVDPIPLTESCKNVLKNEHRDCVARFVEAHIKKELQYPPEALNVKVESSVVVSFVVTKTGEVTSIVANGKPTSFKKAFENEAKRVIGLLPKFIPGKRDNEAVDVRVFIPVIFELEDKIREMEPGMVAHPPVVPAPRYHAEEKPDVHEDVVLPFAIIEQVPLFKDCEAVERSKQNECFQEKMKKHIEKQLKYPKEAKKAKVESRVLVGFHIDKNGNVSNIITRSSNKSEFSALFEEEAKRIIAALPPFKPGLQRGKPMNVSFSIPIEFKIN